MSTNRETLPRGGDRPVDVRITRTRALVIGHTRELLAEHGAAAVTYTEVARRSGTTRQTLYRHWPTIPALIADSVLNGPPTPYPQPSADLRIDLVNFLDSLRRGLDEPATAAGLVALIAAAEHDPDADTALRSLTSDRLNALNTLTGQSPAINADEFARLAGPIIFRRLLQRSNITHDYIEATAESILATRRRRPRWARHATTQ